MRPDPLFTSKLGISWFLGFFLGWLLCSVWFAGEPTLQPGRTLPAITKPAEPIRDSPNQINQREPARPRTAAKGSAEETPPAATVVEPPSLDASDAAPSSATDVDLRPVVFVYSLIQPGEVCIPCARQKADEIDLYEFRFEHRPAPAWVTASPTLEFMASDGKPRQLVGWQGPQWFRERWARNNQFASARHHAANDMGRDAALLQSVAAASSDIAEKIRQFVGDEGTFELRPAKPIKSNIDSSTTLSYSAIKGKIKLEAGVPTIYLTEPQPRIDATKLGFVHVGLTLYQIKILDTTPPTLKVGTSLGSWKFKMEPAQ